MSKIKEALEDIIKAHDSMFNQCCSNPIFDSWGKQINVGSLNDAFKKAPMALAELETILSQRDMIENNEKIELTGSLVSVEKAIKLVRSICGLAGDWIPYEKSADPEERASAMKEIRRCAVALVGKYNILLDQTKKQRDTAWKELREIRKAIEADKNNVRSLILQKKIFNYERDKLIYILENPNNIPWIIRFNEPIPEFEIKFKKES
jgi:hypothetical protein